MKARLIAALALACLCLMLMLVPAGQRAATNHSQALPMAAAHTVQKPGRASPATPSAPPIAAAPETPARVTHVSIIPGDDGKTVVDVGTTRLVQTTRFTLNHPPRLVVDLQNTEMGHFQRVYPGQPGRVGALEDVRVAQFQATPSRIARVVADLSTTETSRIDSDRDGVRIQFQGPAPRVRPKRRSEAAQAGAAIRVYSKAPDPVPTVEAAELRTLERPVQLQPLKAAAPVRPVNELVDLSRPVQVDWAAMRSSRLSSALPNEASRAPSTIRNSAAAAAPIVKLASVTPPRDLPRVLPQAEQALRAAQVLSGSSPSESNPITNSIPSTPGVQQAPPTYTGKLISLDLKSVDIRDFFRLIHQVSGLNIIVDSDVTGKITMVLDDVPWDQALDLVLKNNGLGKVLEGNVLRIAQVKTLTAEAKSDSALRDAKLESEPLVTVFRRLKYAHAEDQKPATGGSSIGGGGGGSSQSNTTPIPGVATILKTFQKGSVLTARGNVVADPRDNAVIITDVESQIPVIESVIDQLDAKSKQVSIQVRVILASSGFTRSLSAVLSGAFRSPQGHTGGAGGTGKGITGVAPTSSPLPALSSVIQPASVAASGFGAFSITTQAARYAINAAITAAESHDQARTISRPTIVTQDNVLGEEQQGVQIPIQTEINNTIAIQYVNATLDLSVTPQVTVDNKIFLKIYVNNASIGSISVLAGPTINTQEATTQVLVPDGGTVVFGGITVTTRGRSATYVPLLGSIPVIGNLFKSSAVNDNNQELLFFVSPMILPG
ncbi:MAG: type IV pilus secretin PilQ [Terriglobia bacterium]